MWTSDVASHSGCLLFPVSSFKVLLHWTEETAAEGIFFCVCVWWLTEGQHPRRLEKRQDCPGQPGQLWCAVKRNPIIKGIACDAQQACLCWSHYLTSSSVILVVLSEDRSVCDSLSSNSGLILFPAPLNVWFWWPFANEYTSDYAAELSVEWSLLPVLFSCWQLAVYTVMSYLLNWPNQVLTYTDIIH